MEIVKTELEGLLILKPGVYRDDRGYFFESYRRELLASYGVDTDFVQDNESMSTAGVLRGLHFQRPPHAQAKLVRVASGAVLDVVVDIRKGSPTFGKWKSLILDQQNKYMMYIAAGFAHGFLTLEDQTIFQYKCTAYYNRESEGVIRWNDPDLGISWGIEMPLVSGKDNNAPLFNEIKDSL